MTIAVVNEEMSGAGCGAWSEGCLITSDMQELDMNSDWDEDWDTEVTTAGPGIEGGTHLELRREQTICEACMVEIKLLSKIRIIESG